MRGELGVLVGGALDHLVGLEVSRLEEVVAARGRRCTGLCPLLVELENIADGLHGGEIVAFQRIEDVDVARVDSLFVSAVLVRLHAVLRLVHAFGLPVESFDPDQVERVS